MTLDARLDALTAALAAAEGRLDDTLLDPARDVVARATERRRVSSGHTVVSLGGATGSGKSSLFNALSGIELAGVGVRRPTTTWTLACTWGSTSAAPLLDWIGVPERQRLTRQGSLDLPSAYDAMLDGLVLLDMPDHDSFVDRHHDEVDAIVARSDLFVWVLDPQKYADAALHDQYLRPRVGHQDNTIIVLNQIDRLQGGDREIALKDVRRLLDEAGLTQTPLLAISTQTGEGVEELRSIIAGRIAGNDAWSKRLEVDVREAAQSLIAVTGTEAAPGISGEHQRRMRQTFHTCVGVPQIGRAVQVSVDRRLRLETGWPFFGWLHRATKDPLASLGLLRSPRDLVADTMPMAPSVQAATADLAVREVTNEASDGMHRDWRRVVLQSGGERAVIDVLDRAVADVDLGLDTTPGWVLPWRLLQWLCVALLVLGTVWSIGAVVGMFSAVPVPAGPSPLGIPLPFWLLTVGLLGGIALTVTSTKFAAAVAARHAQKVEKALDATIDRVIADDIIPPVRAELDRYEEYREHVTAAAV